MAEYSLEFSEKLIETANLLIANGLGSVEANRTVIYLSLLSSEITLKAALEKAGQPMHKIRQRSHNLSELLNDLSTLCEILEEVAPAKFYWRPASKVRGVVVDANYGNATIGTLLECEKQGASQYPNKIRYGNELQHFPSDTICKMAFKLIEWVKLYWDSIQIRLENQKKIRTK